MIEQLANKHGLVVAKTIATTQSPKKRGRSKTSVEKEPRKVKEKGIVDLLGDSGLPRSFDFDKAHFRNSQGCLYYKPGSENIFVTIMRAGGDLLIGISATYRLHKQLSTEHVSVEFYRASVEDALTDIPKIREQLKLAIMHVDKFNDPKVSGGVYRYLFNRNYRYDSDAFKGLVKNVSAELDGHTLVKLDLDTQKYRMYPLRAAHGSYFIERNPIEFERELRDLITKSSKEYERLLDKYNAT